MPTALTGEIVLRRVTDWQGSAMWRWCSPTWPRCARYCKTSYSSERHQTWGRTWRNSSAPVWLSAGLLRRWRCIIPLFWTTSKHYCGRRSRIPSTLETNLGLINRKATKSRRIGDFLRAKVGSAQQSLKGQQNSWTLSATTDLKSVEHQSSLRENIVNAQKGHILHPHLLFSSRESIEDPLIL